MSPDQDDGGSPLTRYLGRPLYWFGGLLVVSTLLEFLLNVWPPQIHSLAWRYAAEGLFSSSLPMLGLGLLLINALALLGQQHRLLGRVMSAHVGLSLFYAILVLDFLFNAWQLRDTAVSDLSLQLVFGVGTLKVAGKYFVMGALQVLAAFGTWRWLRDNPKAGAVQFDSPKRPWWLAWWPDPEPPKTHRSRTRRSR